MNTEVNSSCTIHLFDFLELFFFYFTRKLNVETTVAVFIRTEIPQDGIKITRFSL